MSANEKQVAGNHYRNENGGEQHWDRIWRLYGRGYFVGCATKYIERYHLKNGKEDLQKAIHFLEKLIECEYGKIDQSVDMGQHESNKDNYTVPKSNSDMIKTEFRPNQRDLDLAIKMAEMRNDAMVGIPDHIRKEFSRPWSYIGYSGDRTEYCYQCLSCRKEISVPTYENPPDYCPECGYDGDGYVPLDKGYVNQDGDKNV